jgi:transcriptional regulator with XRE-family HTH domain
MAGQLSPLGERIDKRRAELGLKLKDVADAAGLSIEVLRAIRYGENKSRGITLGAVDRALRWKPGSAEGFVTSGAEPVLLDAPRRVAAAGAAVPGGDEEEDRAATIAAVQQLYGGDAAVLNAAMLIMTNWSKPLALRRAELRGMDRGIRGDEAEARS